MRWTDFFSHLEHDFAQDADPPSGSARQGCRIDSNFVDVCARTKASGQAVTVGLVTGDVFHVSPRAVALDWFSGLVGGEKGAGVVIPVASVLWVESDTVGSRDEKLSLVAATLSEVLADMASRHAHITLRTPHSDVAGVIASVGPGFCDLLVNPAPHSGTTRRFPFHGIVAIFQGAATWG